MSKRYIVDTYWIDYMGKWNEEVRCFTPTVSLYSSKSYRWKWWAHLVALGSIQGITGTMFSEVRREDI